MSIFSYFSPKPKASISPMVLVMLDGWGLAPPGKGNSISLAKTPNMNTFYENYPHGELIASGESVGLPANEVGNSEVGHLTAGVGRVIYQSLKRINVNIEKGEFYENRAITDAIKHCIANNSNLHVMGLAGSGNVHSSINHLYAILQLASIQSFGRVYLHLFTDGRDAPPKEGQTIISQIQSRLSSLKLGSIATVSGRYYAMDRDARWERIQKVYDAMVNGVGSHAPSAGEAIQASYSQGKTDEFVEPTIIGSPPVIKDGDACIYFNFRVDRARELTMAFVLKDFETVDNKNTFKRSKVLNNLFFVTMTQYQENLPVSAIAFPPQTDFPNSLPEVISKNEFKQFHLAESEKERMVGYYFNGMTARVFEGEDLLIVPSPSVPTYDKKPEMSVYKIAEEFKRAVRKNKYKFLVLNIANPDMVAHSGSIPATITAIEHVDKVLGMIVSETLNQSGTVIITADHGNAEEMISFSGSTFFFTTEEGTPNTDHSGNPVPVLIISNELKGKTDKKLNGTLADIAPTILAIMNIPVPDAMQGKNLLAEENNQETKNNNQTDSKLPIIPSL